MIPAAIATSSRETSLAASWYFERTSLFFDSHRYLSLLADFGSLLSFSSPKKFFAPKRAMISFLSPLDGNVFCYSTNCFSSQLLAFLLREHTPSLAYIL
eukprot:g31394.t1